MRVKSVSQVGLRAVGLTLDVCHGDISAALVVDLRVVVAADGV